MSDWQIPDDLADNLRRANYADAWAREIERTAELRGILTDLIAELRAHQEDRETTEWLLASWGECLCDGESPDVDRCTLHNTRQVTSMADRAEQRLREMEDE